MLKRAWNYSPLSGWIIYPLHRKALSTSCLTIGEYCAILALQHPLYQPKPDVVVDLLRGGVLPIDPVKGEALGRVIGEPRVDHGTRVMG